MNWLILKKKMLIISKLAKKKFKRLKRLKTVVQKQLMKLLNVRLVLPIMLTDLVVVNLVAVLLEQFYVVSIRVPW